MMLLAGSAYASGGGPHLWLSADPNQFDKGGVGYVGSSTGWMNKSYVSKNMPLTMYLYNAASKKKGTAEDIGLIVVVHKGDKNGSITIEDAFGVDHTLNYSDFTTLNPYPGNDHGVYDSDGVYAVLKPSKEIDLTTDKSKDEDTSSDASSWTKFVVKSSSFSEVHFDAVSSNAFYNPASHDIDLCGRGDPAPEPATMSLLGLGLFGLIGLKRKK